MKKVAIALMVVGALVLVLGVAWPYQSDSQQYCEQFRMDAIALLDKASQVEGTPESQEFVNEAEAKSAMADVHCDSADEYRSQGLIISGIGFLLVVVGFVLSRKKAAPPAA